MRLFLIMFLFISMFSYGDIPSDNIVKVRIMVKLVEYVTYVVISGDDYLDEIYVVRESL
ncbi:hypothetical protein [Fusobacterium sp.]|uniref:hypothetical protein n=1 Tax=unclassified Fusobacterium TaxID=2648384 RepID=UPI0025B8CCC4|nr:hypothetical protein [Fusobacterium sp.]